MKVYLEFVKPAFDTTFALLALLVLSPLFLIIALAVKLDSPGEIFYKQERIGKNGKPFKIYKFRSMYVRNNYKFGEKLSENHDSITNTGRIIRKTSMDEIPQLINIIKGEMSFIGPRPPVTFYPKKYEDYTGFEKQRFNVKPGLSGLAAIKQREINDWSKNIPIDVEYVNKVCWRLDMELFLKSLLVFFKTDNIYSKIQEK